MSRPIPPSYKIRNWPAYNEALKRRGSLTIWFNPIRPWEAASTGKRGRQPSYSDAAIQTCLTMKGGLEVFVIAGSLSDGVDTLGPWDLLRLPVGRTFEATAGDKGARVWLKTGHLRHMPDHTA